MLSAPSRDATARRDVPHTSGQSMPRGASGDGALEASC
jgi:hypothetical protein